MLRNRKLLIALAVMVLLGLRFLPPQGPGGLMPDSGATGTASKGGNPTKPTVQAVAIDPQRLEEQLHPFIVLRAGTVTRGGQVVIGGQSFEPYQELAISLVHQGEDRPVELGTVTTDKNGVLPDASLGLPEGVARGSYRVVATPVMGGAPVETALQVEAGGPWSKLTADTVKPNGAVGYEGGGFVPGETVFLYLDSLGTEPVASIQASDQGDVSGVFRAPLAREATHLLLFYGEHGKIPVATDLTILGFHPWVVLDNYSPGPEQQVGFAGSDFTPGEQVFVFFESLDSPPVAAFPVGEDGTFKAPGALKLAPGVQGEQTLLFVGDHSQTTAEVAFTIQPYPSVLQLTSYAGPPGSEVAFNGNGFAGGEELRAYMGEPGKGVQVSTFQADEKGNFTDAGGFRVPRDTRSGELTLSVTGQVSGTEASVTYKVLSLSPWGEVKQDPSGGTVVVGHGFAVGEEVELMVGESGDKPMATATADQSGNAQFAPLQIPVESSSGTPIRLKGRDSGGEAKAAVYGGSAPEKGGEPGEPSQGGLEFEPAATPSSATPSPQPQGR